MLSRQSCNLCRLVSYFSLLLLSMSGFANEICSGTAGDIHDQLITTGEDITCTSDSNIIFGPNATVESGARVVLYANSIELVAPLSIATGAEFTASNVVAWREPGLSDLTVSWHQDEDGDQVLAAQDNCRSTYNPGQADTDDDGIGDYCDADFVAAGTDVRVNDLRAMHVSPYGGWFSFTSYLDTIWGYDIQLVWSTDAGQLTNATDLQALIDQGQSQLKRILTYQGLAITKPFIVTAMNPGTQYYVVAVRVVDLGAGDVVDDTAISNQITITTAAEPVINLSVSYPRMWSNPARIADMKQRFDDGDQELQAWIDAFSGDVVQAATDPGAYRRWSLCQSAADIYTLTEDSVYLGHANTLLDLAIDYWRDNTLTDNQYRWADVLLAKCVDLMWNELTVAKKEAAISAIVETTEAEILKGLRIEDTDQTIANIRSFMLEGILICNAPGISSDLQQRGCDILQVGKRNFYGLEVVRMKRAYGFLAHAGAALPDGSFYGAGTGNYWLEIFNALINSGEDLAEYGDFFSRRLFAMFLQPLLPSATGYTTWGDIESFTGSGREIDTSPVGGTVQLASLINILNELGMTTPAGYAKFFFAEHFSSENSTFTTSQDLLHLANDSILPIDYRPEINTAFFSSGIGIFSDRSNWQSDASYLAYRGGQMHADHIHSDNGHFQLYRKGRWLTHESISYDGTSAQAPGHNVLILEGSNPYQSQFSALGAATTFAVSSTGNYSFMASDITGDHLEGLEYSVKRYDRVHRALVWLKNAGSTDTDTLIVFDLVDIVSSASDNMGKKFQLHLDQEPTLTGRHAQVILPGTTNQVVDVDFLFPTSTVLSKTGPDPGSERDEFATPPYTHRLFANPNVTRDLRMLTVIQGNDQGVTYVPATGVESSTLIGTVVNNQLVLFPKAGYSGQPLQNHQFVLTAAQTASSEPIAAIITGLPANTGYSVVETMLAGELTVQIQVGSDFQTNHAGVLLLTLDQ